MRVQWESWNQSTWGPRPIFPEFPGLAGAQGASEDGASGDPFALINDDTRRQSWEPTRSLLLVPCRRPADVGQARVWRPSWTVAGSDGGGVAMSFPVGDGLDPLADLLR
jgi:hypothetical protein